MTLWVREGKTRDIMEGVLESVQDDEWIKQTSEYAAYINESYPNVLKQLEMLWAKVRSRVKYIEDPLGVQNIKSPALTWYHGFGDCKSMTVFISSVMSNLDIAHYIRFTAYGIFQKYTHVYPVAIIQGKEIPVDAVYHYFGHEPRYARKKDYKVELQDSLTGFNYSWPIKFVIE